MRMDTYAHALAHTHSNIRNLVGCAYEYAYPYRHNCMHRLYLQCVQACMHGLHLMLTHVCICLSRLSIYAAYSCVYLCVASRLHILQCCVYCAFVLIYFAAHEHGFKRIHRVYIGGHAYAYAYTMRGVAVSEERERERERERGDRDRKSHSHDFWFSGAFLVSQTHRDTDNIQDLVFPERVLHRY
jgi:hypothetical protein